MYQRVRQEYMMINANLDGVTTLEEFYNEIRKQQEEAHGNDYCNMHDAIVKYWKEGNCTEYMELGTHQGGTASCAMQLEGVTQIQLVDIDMSRYRKYLSPIAFKHCAKNNINLILREMDSRSLTSIGRCDMLVIDSVHNPNFMQQELDMHAHNVRKYIIAHDTFMLQGRQNNALHQCLMEFSRKNPRWKILHHEKKGPGYTVLGR